jgi:hypothetical protein
VRWRALPAFAAIDFVSCMLVVFVAVALTSKPPEVKTYGSYAVVITWPHGTNDVDLYVRDPAGAIAYFRNTQVDQMQLEHDDLGTRGTGYAANLNEERTVIRSTSPGQYVVDTNMYFRSQGTGAVPVKVDLWSLQGSDHIIRSRTVTLMHTGDERTPFRFTVDAAGKVTGYSYVPVSLVRRSTIAGGN